MVNDPKRGYGRALWPHRGNLRRVYVRSSLSLNSMLIPQPCALTRGAGGCFIVVVSVAVLVLVIVIVIFALD